MDECSKLVIAKLHGEGALVHEDEDPDVDIVVDEQPLAFSAQYQGVARSGERTIDTLLDKDVFGVPITGFDLWQQTVTFARGGSASQQ